MPPRCLVLDCLRDKRGRTASTVTRREIWYNKRIQMKKNDEKHWFQAILGIIKEHRACALASVNVEHLLSCWQIGGVLSSKIKQDGWGRSTIDRLVDYIHTNAPDEKGYGRSNLYSMVGVYEAFSAEEFICLTEKHARQLIVQMPSGQISHETDTSIEFPGGLEIVQMPSGQLRSMPEVLALTTFSNLVEIVNRVKSTQERLFYIVYAHRERLKTLELRKCIVDDAYASLLGGGKKNFSKALKTIYPDSPVMFKDAAFVDFLNLPAKHTEKRLRRGIVKNMKDFILSIGKDFLFVDEEYTLTVGGKDFRADLLFYHRALQCLVAVELKAREFRPSDMGQLEFYLEALDRDVRRQNENPSIGILLCKNADRSVVEYAMSRTMSPAMVAEYKRVMIPKEVLQETFETYLALPTPKKNGVHKRTNRNLLK